MLATLKYALRSVKQVEGTSGSRICSELVEITWIVSTLQNPALKLQKEILEVLILYNFSTVLDF